MSSHVLHHRVVRNLGIGRTQIHDRYVLNADGEDTLDILDLTYLIDFMFQGGPPPPVPQQADVDNTGTLDISDLVCLIDFMFTGGPVPVCGS